MAVWVLCDCCDWFGADCWFSVVASWLVWCLDLVLGGCRVWLVGLARMVCCACVVSCVFIAGFVNSVGIVISLFWGVSFRWLYLL